MPLSAISPRHKSNINGYPPLKLALVEDVRPGESPRWSTQSVLSQPTDKDSEKAERL